MKESEPKVAVLVTLEEGAELLTQAMIKLSELARRRIYTGKPGDLIKLNPKLLK